MLAVLVVPDVWAPRAASGLNDSGAASGASDLTIGSRIVNRLPLPGALSTVTCPLVDIGAGSGYFTRRFAAAVGPAGKAIGVEIDSAMVHKLNADARRLSLTNYEARLVPPDDPMLDASSVDTLNVCCYR
jgi:SAM-dependent methyltransferase